ncbi:MAG: DUF5615 family PIN-like protein [Verrucomicrobiota bacterium]
MARLFADEDFSFPIIERLRHLQHDVITVSDIGKANQRWPDDEVFFFAVAQQRIILTKNRRHFFKLHQQFPAHHGIVACTEDPDFAGATHRIHQAISTEKPLTGQFIRIYQPHQIR